MKEIILVNLYELNLRMNMKDKDMKDTMNYKDKDRRKRYI